MSCDPNGANLEGFQGTMKKDEKLVNIQISETIPSSTAPFINIVIIQDIYKDRMKP